MKTLYIADISADTPRFQDFFQVNQADRKTMKTGAAYLALKLGDRTGNLEARVWTIPPDLQALSVSVGDRVKVEAIPETYRDAVQLKITKIRKVTGEDILDDGDFIPASKHDRDELFERLQFLIADVSKPDLRAALIEVTVLLRDKLRNAPAAMKMHQAYLGGLLEHILNLIGLAKQVTGVYPSLDYDVLVGAAVLHDIGKVEELAYSTAVGITAEGRLLGHVTQGLLMTAQALRSVERSVALHLTHIIISHHGNLEWGALRTPMTAEAQMFHLLDMIDSRMAIVSETVTNGPLDADGFTPYVNALGNPIWTAPTSQLQLTTTSE